MRGWVRSEPHDYCKAQGFPVTGNNLSAAMNLVGLKAEALARASNVSPATIIRWQASGRKAVRADAATIHKVVKGLELNGVEITEDGVRLMQKPLP
jgi:transcriptional regulator with XRE-family HTH domain